MGPERRDQGLRTQIPSLWALPDNRRFRLERKRSRFSGLAGYWGAPGLRGYSSLPLDALWSLNAGSGL